MRTAGWKQKLVISDLGSEHLRNLITMHIEREAKKKKKEKAFLYVNEKHQELKEFRYPLKME